MSKSFERFGNYVLLEKVASGGMAEIYLARSESAEGLGKFFAIKRILPAYSSNPEFINMFKQEAKIAMNLSHSNIISIFDFGFEQNQLFIVMEYSEGKNLRQILNRVKKNKTELSIEQALFVIRESALGLDHAHRSYDPLTGKPLNIIHRDMSPQNIMINFEGEVKLIDFGIAKSENQNEVTRVGTLKGKFGYMSPEQAEGQTIDSRTDIFSLGVVLWELLANDRLFIADNDINTLKKIRDCHIPSLRKINPQIPEELEQIVTKALSKEVNLRFQSAAIFYRELNRFLNRNYPDFTGQDFGIYVRTLFANEVFETRKKMIEFAKLKLSEVSPREKTNEERTFIVKKEQATDPSYTYTEEDSDNAQINLEKASSKSIKSQNDSQSYENKQNNSIIIPLRKKQKNFQTSPSISEKKEVKVQNENNDYNFRKVENKKFWSLMIVIFIFLGLILAHFNGKLETIQNKIFQNNETEFITNPKTPEVKNEATRNQFTGDDRYVRLPVTSHPAGAEIFLDEQNTGKRTPAHLTLIKGTTTTIGIRKPGYGSFQEQVFARDARRVHATLRPSSLGYLDIYVEGSGQISINGRVVSRSSPARGIAVPANQDIRVSVFDPNTQATDEIMVRVSENRVRRVTLVPRAPNTRNPSNRN